MAIPWRQNRWWWDVLTYGPNSNYANYFDIDWTPPAGNERNTVLVPILGDHYGRVLESKQLQLARDPDGAPIVRYYDNELPLDPATVTIDAADDAAIARLNNDVDALDELLMQQHYRVAYWKVAGDELDYRRFFDINTLVGIRAERQEVFDDTHDLVVGWLRDGTLDGVRIDHIDGLRDPMQYLRRLRAAAGDDKWIVVEKILEPEERLPASWPVQGTTGYDALNRIGGLFVEPSGAEPLTDFYQRFTGQVYSWAELVEQSKCFVLANVLKSDLHRLVELFGRAAAGRRRYRDYTRRELQQALFDTLVAMPVYRSYAVPDSQQVTRADEEHVRQAIEVASAKNSNIDAELFEFLADVLTLRAGGELEAELSLRFQQLSGPVMAKGVEDTAFYRYHRLISLNEVGGDPGHFGTRPDDFHESAAEAQRMWPTAMVASTTHDTKRSEDVRHRVALLSEVPGLWADAVEQWSKINEVHRRPVNPDDPDGQQYPDRNMEYLIYQTLVGAYPISADRLAEYVAKASKEAKQYTSWTEPSPAYDDALATFVAAILSNAEFNDSLQQFVGNLVRPGYINSLAAAAVKLTMPGVPDIYQGVELWDFSLVDPDNRRPVDYGKRRAMLSELDPLSVEQIMARLHDGMPKLHLTRQALDLRGRRPDSFDERGAYLPLAATGQKALHTFAFQRSGDVATVVPRLIMGAGGDWGDTTVVLPDGQWRNVLTGAMSSSVIKVNEHFQAFPVSIFERIS